MKFFFYLVLLVAAQMSYGMDPVAKAAQNHDQARNHFFTKMEVNHVKVDVMSYFDLTTHRPVVEDALQPNIFRCYDLRGLETMYCRLAQNSQRPHIKHRGKIGFFAGVALTALPYAYAKLHEKKAHV